MYFLRDGGEGLFCWGRLIGRILCSRGIFFCWYCGNVLKSNGVPLAHQTVFVGFFSWHAVVGIQGHFHVRCVYTKLFFVLLGDA